MLGQGTRRVLHSPKVGCVPVSNLSPILMEIKHINLLVQQVRLGWDCFIALLLPFLCERNRNGVKKSHDRIKDEYGKSSCKAPDVDGRMCRKMIWGWNTCRATAIQPPFPVLYIVVYLSVMGAVILQLLIWVTSHAIEAELSEDGVCLCWGVGFRETVFFYMVWINVLLWWMGSTTWIWGLPGKSWRAIKYISTPESSIHGRSYGRGSQEEDSCTASSVGHETCNRDFSVCPERTCLHEQGIIVRRDMWVLVSALTYELVGRMGKGRMRETCWLAIYHGSWGVRKNRN